MPGDIIDLVVDKDGSYVPKDQVKEEKVSSPRKIKKLRRKLVRRKKKHSIKEAGGEFITGLKAGLSVVDELLSTLNKFNRGL